MRWRTSIWLACAALLGAGMASAAPRDQPELAEATTVETLDAATWMKWLQGRFVLDGSIHHVAYVDRNGTFVPFDEVYPGGDLEAARPELQSMREWSQPVAAGKADCIGFADGPGVQCVVHMDWPWGPDGILDPPSDSAVLSYRAPATQVHSAPGGVAGASHLKPGMVLAGLAPSAPGTIRYLLVDHLGLANPGVLVLQGNAAIARTPCVNQPGTYACEQIFRIEAKPGAKVAFLTFGTRTRYRRSVEIPSGWAILLVEELLELSFSLHREAQVSEDPQAVAPPATP